ncbi:hypothetical protein O9X98_15335 [Agrobacterium salinitolerans]|nr:hypothetical protein [Agrobacterium salinitolerans]
MDPISTFNASLIPYRDHLHEVWMRTTGSDKTIDPVLREAFEAAQSALRAGNATNISNILETGSYLVDCYERLVRGERVADLAEAEGGYNYYLTELEPGASSGPALTI